MKQLKQFALAILAMTVFFSCKKKDDTTNPTPTHPNTSRVISKAKLLGKWKVTSNYQLRYDANNTVVSGDGASETFNQYGITPLPPSIPASYITFNNDNSFDLTDGNGAPGGSLTSYLMPNHGQWILKNNDTTLNFEIKPSAGHTDIDYESQEFNDSYAHLTYIGTSLGLKTIWHYEFKK